MLETFARRYDGDCVTITFGTEKVEATGGHPFWVIEGENLAERSPCDVLPDCEQDITPYGKWVYARHLCEGDVIQSKSREGG